MGVARRIDVEMCLARGDVCFMVKMWCLETLRHLHYLLLFLEALEVLQHLHSWLGGLVASGECCRYI
jgi:hypothetical protein